MKTKSRNLSSLRILMQMRENALTHRGGDTVVMERVTAGLRKMGHEVDIDLRSELDPGDYDLLHLFNFATPEITEGQARRSVEARTPFVVTTMYEDWPFFFHHMVETFLALESYIIEGQKIDKWEALFANRQRLAPSEIQDNTFTAAHAGALIPTGQNEKDALLRDYPQTSCVEIYRCGCEVSPFVDGGEMFRKAYNLKEYVLCVGRLEWRKNQLMLLKALETSDIPLVFATGGFTYQREYEALCRRFKRAGKTLFLGRLEPEMLASALQGASVHALPSFYELPGLVSIEAANYGTNLVVTDYGTVRDYVGDDAFYCAPNEPQSVLNAIHAAMKAPRKPNLVDRVKPFTWENAAKRNLEIYEKVLSKHGYVHESLGVATTDYGSLDRLGTALRTIENATDAVSTAGATVAKIPSKLEDQTQPASASASVQTLCDEGDFLIKKGEIDEAVNRFKTASKLAPNLSRPFRSLGVASLTTNRYADAEGYFRRALLIDPKDRRAELGLSMARYADGRKEDSFTLASELLKSEPTDLKALYHFISLCYDLNKLPELEKALRTYLSYDVKNPDMLFCLAGCLYRQGKLDEATELNDTVLQLKPEHSSAIELRQLLPQRRVERVRLEPMTVSPVTPSTHVSKASVPQTSENKASMTLLEALATRAMVGEFTTPPVEPEFDPAIESLEFLLKEKKYSELFSLAQRLQDEATRTENGKALVSIIRAEAVACMGRFDDAEASLRTFENHAVHAYRAVSSLGVIQGARNNWASAEEYFRKSLSLNPRYDVALAGMGICLSVRGQKEGAWEYFMASHELNPENLRAILGLVELAYPLSRLEQLERALLRYLDFFPGNLSILYAYAGCAYAQGKTDTALEQIQKIKIFDPENALANELLKKIEEDGPTFNRANA